jgi:CheY-like chemotaxis protein
MKMKRILMVDDDNDFAAGIRLILASQGYAFTHISDPALGLKRLAEVDPDLIILDVVMNNRTEGYRFAKELRGSQSHGRYAQTPILLLTGMRGQKGFDFIVKPEDAMFLPCDEFLEKPVKPEVLLETVARMIPR